MHRDPHQLPECLQTSVPVALRGRRTDFIIVLSAFFLYSKHHCDPKLEDKRTHFSWFENLWGKPKPSFICRCVLEHGFVYSSVFSKLCWKVKSSLTWILWWVKLCIAVIYRFEDVGCFLFVCLTREHKPALKFSFTGDRTQGTTFYWVFKWSNVIKTWPFKTHISNTVCVLPHFRHFCPVVRWVVYKKQGDFHACASLPIWDSSQSS